MVMVGKYASSVNSTSRYLGSGIICRQSSPDRLYSFARGRKGAMKSVFVTVSLMFLLATQPVNSQEKHASLEDYRTMSLEDLMNVEVSVASKSQERLSDAPGIISVITRDELDRFGGTTLRDILERVVSINSMHSYLVRSMISIRGDQTKETSSHVLVLINGRPVRERVQSGTDCDFYEAFPVNAIEHIEVIRGPGSVLYGTNAYSGVIDIITKKHDDTNVAVDAFGTEGGGIGTNASVSIHNGDLDVYGAVRYLDKPVWEREYEKSTLATSETPFDTSFMMNVQDEALGGFFSVAYGDVHIMTMYTGWNHHILDPSPTYDAVTYSRIFGDIGYTLDISEKWIVNFNITGTVFEQTARIGRESLELLGEWANNVELTDDIRMVVGGTYTYVDGKETAKDTIKATSMDDDERSFTVYNQVDFQVMDNLKLIGGFQYNKVERQGGDLVPRLGAVYYLTDAISIKTLYAQAFRAPSLDERSVSDPRLVGNPDLDAEEVNTFDFSVTHLGEQIQSSLTYYYTKQNDLIKRSPEEKEDGREFFDNISELVIQGIELESKYYVNTNLLLVGGLTYQSNESGTTRNFTPVPNLTAKIGASLKTDNGITVSLFNIYNGRLDEDQWPESQYNPSYEAHNLLSLHASFELNKIFDLRMKQRLSIYLYGDNLFDNEVFVPDWVRAVEMAMTHPAKPGRLVYGGIRVNF